MAITAIKAVKPISVDGVVGTMRAYAVNVSSSNEVIPDVVYNVVTGDLEAMLGDTSGLLLPDPTPGVNGNVGISLCRLTPDDLGPWLRVRSPGGEKHGEDTGDIGGNNHELVVLNEKMLNIEDKKMGCGVLNGRRGLSSHL